MRGRPIDNKVLTTVEIYSGFEIRQDYFTALNKTEARRIVAHRGDIDYDVADSKAIFGCVADAKDWIDYLQGN